MHWEMKEEDGDQDEPMEVEWCQRVCDGSEYNNQTYTKRI